MFVARQLAAGKTEPGRRHVPGGHLVTEPLARDSDERRPESVTGVLDWDGADVSFTRTADQLCARATYRRAGAAPIAVDISATYLNDMWVGTADPESSRNFEPQERLPGLAAGGLCLQQHATRLRPWGTLRERRNDRGNYTFAFSRQVSNLRFGVSVPASRGGQREAIEMTPAFALAGPAVGVDGVGSRVDPFRLTMPPNPDPRAAGWVEVRCQSTIQAFSIDLWNMRNAFSCGNDQVVYISDLTFDYAPHGGSHCQVR